MPKVELHKHLEGSIRLSTLLELTAARRARLGLPEGELSASAFIFDKPLASLSVFIEVFFAHQVIMDSYASIERIAYEVVEDAARENVRLLELRYSPHFVRLHHEDLEYEQIHAAVLRGIARAQLRYEVGVGLIGIIDRSQSLEEATAAMDFFLAHRADLVAVDLANDEIKFPADPFVALFAKARGAGLHVTIHAGETTAPESVRNVRQAVEVLGATRIGHGVMSIKDDATIELLKQRHVVLEVCPVSNYLTGLVDDLARHPIKELVARGVEVTVSTDDPGVFGHSLEQEYQRLLDLRLLTLDQLTTANRTAARASFIPDHVKRRFWDPKDLA